MSGNRLVPPVALLLERASAYMEVSATELTVTPLLESNANYVFRVQSMASSIVLKWSNNISPSIGWQIDQEHLMHEFLFLRNAQTLSSRLIALPEPLFFDSDLNVLGVSDLGIGVLLEQAPITYFLQDGILWGLGEFLAATHMLTYDHEFSDRLRRNEFYKSICKFKLDSDAHWDYLTEFSNHRSCVTLMDFSPRNILCINSHLGVIDFDFVSYGDPFFDIAQFQAYMLWIFLNVRSNHDYNILMQFFDGYSARSSSHVFANPKDWQRFCRYISALLQHRMQRAKGKNEVGPTANALQYIFNAKCNSWRQLVELLHPGEDNDE